LRRYAASSPGLPSITAKSRVVASLILVHAKKGTSSAALDRGLGDARASYGGPRIGTAVGRRLPRAFHERPGAESNRWARCIALRARRPGRRAILRAVGRLVMYLASVDSATSTPRISNRWPRARGIGLKPTVCGRTTRAGRGVSHSNPERGTARFIKLRPLKSSMVPYSRLFFSLGKGRLT
jgi:hypothetical protein